MTDAHHALRVLHLLLWLVPGGAGTQAYVRALLAAFRDAPDVHLLGAAVHPGAAPAGFAEPPHLGVARPSWRNVVAFCLHVWRAAPQVDLVQIHGIYGAPFVLGALLCWVRGVPYVVNPHNALAPWMLAQKAPRKRLFFGTLGGFLLRRAACVLATSAPEAEAIARRFPGARVRCVRAGVAVPDRPSVTLLHETAAAELRFLYLGSFEPWKRVPLLVRAVAALRARGIAARATICGQGTPEQEQAIRDAVAQAGIASAVTLAGYVAGEAKWALIRGAHALVLPAITDSYSMATAEALAEGLPVVVTTGAGTAPDVQREDCGSVVPADDADALAVALREYADPAMRQARALRAHRYARQALALPVFRTAMTQLYRECARPA